MTLNSNNKIENRDLMVIVYGLKNCDTCRTALKWLNAQGRDARFHDLRIDPIDLETIEGWMTKMGLENLLNRRSKTWRDLPDSKKQNINSRNAGELICAHPSVIKRPIFIYDKGMLIGFSDRTKENLMATK